MTSTLLAILITLAAGLPAAMALEPSLGWRARVGVGFLLGSGMASLVLLIATFVGVPWSRPVLFVPLALLALAFLPAALRVARRPGTLVLRPAVVLADCGTFAAVAGYALFATAARPWEWDFWAIWGLKAKESFLARGFAIEFLSRPDNVFSHPDYPPLISLVYDTDAIIAGGWDDRWLGAVSVAFSVALLLVMRDELERQAKSAVVGAVGTFALTGAACLPWIGLGDGPLVAAATAGLVLVSRGLRMNAPRPIVAGSLLVGVATLAKNEGTTLVLAMVVASLLVRRQRWAFVALPASLVMMPWMLVRAFATAPTYLLQGGFVERVSARLADPVDLLWNLAQGRVEKGGLWIVLALLLLLVPDLKRREAFLLAVIGLQSLAFVAVYAGTHYDLAWHVRTSLDRVTAQLAPLVGTVAVLGAGLLMRAGATHPQGPGEAEVPEGEDDAARRFDPAEREP